MMVLLVLFLAVIIIVILVLAKSGEVHGKVEQERDRRQAEQNEPRLRSRQERHEKAAHGWVEGGR